MKTTAISTTDDDLKDLIDVNFITNNNAIKYNDIITHIATNILHLCQNPSVILVTATTLVVPIIRRLMIAVTKIDKFSKV